MPKGNIEDDGNRIQLGWIEWLAIAGHERASTLSPIRDRKPGIRPSLDATGCVTEGSANDAPRNSPTAVVRSTPWKRSLRARPHSTRSTDSLIPADPPRIGVRDHADCISNSLGW